jgi:predicted peptidase
MSARRRAVAIALLALATAFGAMRAEARDTGFLDRTIVVDGVPRRYQVYVPAEWTPQRRWPIALALHGAGERGTDGKLQTEIGMAQSLRRYSSRWPLVVVFPQCPPDTRWPGASSRIALAALDAAAREFHGDPDRTYLTGLSMGGNGAWYLAYRDPLRWAAILVACGWVHDDRNHATAEPIVPAADGEPVPTLAARLRHVPVWLWHGAKDDVIAPADSRAIAAALDSLGAPARYTELPEGNHGSWEPMYADSAVAAWLLAQRRRR